MISLSAVLRSLGVDVQCSFHNSGNDAFLSLLALQLLLDKDNTKVPQMRGKSSNKNGARMGNWSASGMPAAQMPLVPAFPMIPQPQLSPAIVATYGMNAYLDNEFGAMRRAPGHSNNNTVSKRGKGGVEMNNSSRKSMADELSSSMKNLKTG